MSLGGVGDALNSCAEVCPPRPAAWCVFLISVHSLFSQTTHTVERISILSVLLSLLQWFSLNVRELPPSLLFFLLLLLLSFLTFSGFHHPLFTQPFKESYPQEMLVTPTSSPPMWTSLFISTNIPDLHSGPPHTLCQTSVCLCYSRPIFRLGVFNDFMQVSFCCKLELREACLGFSAIRPACAKSWTVIYSEL